MSTSNLDILRGLTEERVRDMFFGKIYERAKSYYRDRRVRHPRRMGTMLEADVQGTELYTVKIKVQDGTIFASCTCPFAEMEACKHIGAVLLQWIREPESFAVAEGEEEPFALEPSRVYPERSEGARTAATVQVAETVSPQKPSPLSRPPWWYEQPDTLPSSSMDSDEADSNMPALLEHLQLAELREIARQRGWRVKGNNKADYVAALVPLLGNPTEIARAVTSLPDELREALLAAFVAEDGGGISPANLAHIMTALRGGAKPQLKPVEAAGLLLDLARWGLVIPWRDSPSGLLRYLFPWEVQRHVPPLPGWCRQSPQAPSAQVLSTDGNSFVQLLYKVWERISLEPPALRPPLEPLPEGRFLNVLQDWTYDPQEVGDWLARGRGRMDPALRTLSVPPPAFLLDDASLSALAPLTDSHLEQLEFVCRLLCELDLVSTEGGYLLARPEVMSRFMCSSTVEQYTVLTQAYISLPDWSELDTLLRTDTRLMLWRTVHSLFSHDQFRSHLVRLRHMLLRFLATAGEEGWCSLADVQVALRALWPQFSTAPDVENQHWLSRAWGLAWRSDQRELHSDDTLDWRAAQGGFLRIMLEGPLYWLGLAELCRQDGELIAFRLRGLADLMWDRPMAMVQMEPTREAVMVDKTNLTITVHPGAVPPQTHTLLGHIARLEESTPGRFVYRLDMRTAHAAFERGELLSDLLAAWEAIMPLPIPETPYKTLSDWWARYGQVRLYEGLALLELGDDVASRELEASTSLSQHIVAKLSPRLVLVPDGAVKALLREFAAKGYMPKEAK